MSDFSDMTAVVIFKEKNRAFFDCVNPEDWRRSFSETTETIFNRQSIIYQKNIHHHRCESKKIFKNGCLHHLQRNTTGSVYKQQPFNSFTHQIQHTVLVSPHQPHVQPVAPASSATLSLLQELHISSSSSFHGSLTQYETQLSCIRYFP